MNKYFTEPVELNPEDVRRRCRGTAYLEVHRVLGKRHRGSNIYVVASSESLGRDFGVCVATISAERPIFGKTRFCEENGLAEPPIRTRFEVKADRYEAFSAVFNRTREVSEKIAAILGIPIRKSKFK